MCLTLFVRLPIEAAAIWSLLAGYLLLPSTVSVDVAMMPPLDKSTVPAISTFLLCWMKGTRSPAPLRRPLIYCLAATFALSPIITSLNNSYELQIAGRSLPGFYPLNAVKIGLENLITLVPFFVGMRFVSSDNGRALLLKSTSVAALFYSLPMLFELRMSPQLQRLVYGSAPSGFDTLVRAGGYRPIVFLSTGLELALFTCMAFIAAVVGVRCKWRLFHVSAGAAAAYLGGLLLLCKTLGSILSGALAAPLVLFTKPRTWVRISCFVALTICAYPLLRTHDLIPVNRVAAVANAVSTDRSSSFAFRVENEDKLLSKANQNRFFGWGTWGRNRVYDRQTGEDLAVTDGLWIIRFGMFGWFGYLSLFGLFATAMFSALSAVKGRVTESTIVVGGLALILAVNLIDLIPNANLLPLTFLLGGSIAGRAPVSANARVLARRPTSAEAAADADLAA